MFLLTLYISLKTLSHSDAVSRKRFSGQEDFAHLSVFLYPFISFCLIIMSLYLFCSCLSILKVKQSTNYSLSYQYKVILRSSIVYRIFRVAAKASNTS